MYGYQNGWPGVPGVRLPLSSCGCNDFPAQPCSPFPICGPNGCPIHLDSACVIYHKNMNTISGLVNLNLPNGSTLELILNTIDVQLGPLNVSNWSLPVLRAIYTINTLKQFGEAVDTQIGLINDAIADLEASAVPIVATDSATIDFTTSGTLDHNITASVKISASANNLLIANVDGLYSTPQTLSIDYVNKTLSITEGNEVDFSSLVCGASGFLGNVTSDPTAIDGQYWFRTDLSAASGLRIKLNGSVRTITTS